MGLIGTDRGAGSNNTTGTTYVITPGSNFLAGSLAVLVIVCDNSGTAGVDPITGVTDSVGNTWTFRMNGINNPGTVSSGVVARIYDSPMATAALTTGNTITVAFTPTTVAKAYTLHEIKSDAGGTPLYNQGNTGGAAFNPAGTTTGTLNIGDLLIAALGAESGTTQTFTGDSDTTNGTWTTQQTSSVGTTTTGIGITTQRKVSTAVATQDYDITLGIASDWQMIWAAWREVLRPTVTMARRAWSSGLNAPFLRHRTVRKTHRPRFFGLLPSSTTYIQNFTAGLSFVGSMGKQTVRSLPAGLSFVGAINRRTTRTLSAGLSFVGGFSKSTLRLLAGGLSFVGGLSTSFIAAVVAFPVVLRNRLRNRTFEGRSRSIGSLESTSSFFQNFTADLSFSGTINRRTSRSLTAGLSFVGALTKRTYRALSGGLSFVGAFSKQANKALSGVLSFSGSMNRLITKSLTGALSFVGSMTKRTSRALSGGLSFVGGLSTSIVNALAGVVYRNRLRNRTFEGRSRSIGSLESAGSFAATFTAGLSFSGSISKRTSRPLAAGLSFVGSLAKRTARRLTGTLSFVGTFTKSRIYFKALAATLSFSGSLTRSFITDVTRLGGDALQLTKRYISRPPWSRRGLRRRR